MTELTWIGNNHQDLAFQLVAVPEPSSLALVALAGAALVWLRNPRSGTQSTVRVPK